MTDIAKANILERWDRLAKENLGDAEKIRNFFQLMFDGDMGEGYYRTNEMYPSDQVTRILRGFEYNTGYGSEDGLYLSFCLDLHTVMMSTEMLEEFDHYLMFNMAPYEWAENNWCWYWQELVKNETTKNRRHRKKA